MSRDLASHQRIIERAGGPTAFARAIGADPNTVKAWKRTNSIPAPHWQAISVAELATLSELANAAAQRAAA